MSKAQRSVIVPAVLVEVVELLVHAYEQAMGLPDAKKLEWTVHEGLKEVDRRAMEICFQQKAREAESNRIAEVRCKSCEEWAGLYQSEAPRYVITVRGRVDYQRPVFRCEDRGCQVERCLFDEELGLEPKEHFTPMMQDKIAWSATTQDGFARASADLAHQVELPVSPTQVHRVFEKIGDRALERQDEEVKRRGAPASLDKPVPVEERPETVVIELDGTCVMGRDGEGHEVKCATVFGLDARATTGSPGKERPILLRRCYCATSKGIRPFGAMTWALATWWGVRSAKRVAVIGDGGEWIWNWSRERLHFTEPDGTVVAPVEILDFYHAAENLAKARNAIYADPEAQAAKTWYDTWRTRLRQGEIEPLIQELQRRMRQAKDPLRQNELRTRAQYFEFHKERMRYRDYEAMNLPIGSGAIEGTCKNLIKGRMDGVGMRWDAEQGIERMTALRVRLFNDRWSDLWPHGEFAQMKAA